MNRKFKFRVWSKQLNRWLSKDEWYFDFDGNIHFIDVFPESTDGPISPIIDANQFVIQQYTNLNDKTEKEICEGDIVRIPCYTYNKESNSPAGIEYDIAVCQYDESGARFLLNCFPLDRGYGGFDFHIGMSNKIEIIGTVLENTNLLEQLNTNLEPFKKVTDEELLKYLKK